MANGPLQGILDAIDNQVGASSGAPSAAPPTSSVPRAARAPKSARVSPLTDILSAINSQVGLPTLTKQQASQEIDRFAQPPPEATEGPSLATAPNMADQIEAEGPRLFVDTASMPRNVFTNQIMEPGELATEEEKKAGGTIGPYKQTAGKYARNLATALSEDPAALTAEQNATRFNMFTTGPNKIPFTNFSPEQYQQSVQRWENDALVPKSRGKAFWKGFSADAIKDLNDMILSPLGLAATTTGAAETIGLARAGAMGADGIRLAQDYEAMRAAGATEPELNQVLDQMKEVAVSTARAQKAAIAAKGAGEAAAFGFGAQGTGSVAQGIKDKSLPETLSGAGQLLLGGAAAAGAARAGSIADRVKAETLARAVEQAPEMPTAVRTAQIGEEPIPQQAAPQLPAAPLETKAQAGNIEPVGAGEKLAPEVSETLKAQTDALAKGTVHAVYFPKGTPTLPEPPENAQVTVVNGKRRGAGTYYHDSSITPEQIRTAVKQGTYGELLGHVQTKEEAGENPVAVVARDDKGTELKASVVDSADPEAIAEQTAELAKQFPEAQISAEPPQKVVAERVNGEQPTGATPQEKTATGLPRKFQSRTREELATKQTAPQDQAQALRTDNIRMQEAIRQGMGTEAERADATKRIQQNEEMIRQLEGRAMEAQPKSTEEISKVEKPEAAEPPQPTHGYKYSELGPSAEKWNKMAAAEDRLDYLRRAGFSAQGRTRLASRMWADLPTNAKTRLGQIFEQEHRRSETKPVDHILNAIEEQVNPQVAPEPRQKEQTAEESKQPAPKEGTDVPEKGTETKPIQTFENKEDGTQAEVSKVKKGYSVAVRDTDSGDVLPTVKIYPTEEKAVDAAQKLTAKPPENLTPERTIEPEKESANAHPPQLAREGEKPLEEVPPENVQRAGAEREPGERLNERSGQNTERANLEPAQRNEPVGGAERGGEEQPATAERRGHAEPGRALSSQSGSSQPGYDYRITEADHIGEGTEREKFAANAEAIRVLKELEAAGRTATPEDQAKLVKYTGWGWSGNKLNDYHDQWVKERKQLKELLTEEEYDAAVASTKNAHYTSPQVITPIWNAVRRLGFTGGRILEPSAGIGHFLGLMPNDLYVNSRKTAIELDKISGRILKQLYQSVDARIQGFEELSGLNNFYDLAISNVPFGDYKVHDPAYNKFNLSIHNYFIAKMLDKVRPGGLVVAITSHYTMDSSKFQRARELFAKKGDLLDAIRLPGGAFAKNAGTDVTTDILFFKKRAENEAPSGHKFIGLADVPTNIRNQSARVNEYFKENPTMALGQHSMAGTMNRGYGEEYKLLPFKAEDAHPLKEQLDEAVSRLPENVMTGVAPPKSTTEKAAIEAEPAWGETKPFGYAVKDGKVFQNLDGRMVHVENYPKSNVQALSKMLDMRNSVRELFGMEAKGRTGQQLTEARARLNRQYDGFVKKHGYLNAASNVKAIGDDPDGPLLWALENWDKKTKTAKKADVFFKPTITPRKEVTSVERPEDALPASLAEKGRIDFDYMSKLSGVSIPDLQTSLREAGVAFRAPQGHWETKDEYLSGNVRQKLHDAEEAAKIEPEFKHNVEALKAVQPRDLEAGEIGVRAGTPWIPEEDIANFIDSVILETRHYGRRTRVRHITSEGSWIVENNDARYNEAARTRWGTDRVKPLELINDALNLRRPTVYDNVGEGKKVVNEKATLAARDKLEQIDQAFQDWIFKDPERAERLVSYYNENFNNLMDRKFDGSHLTFPGKSLEIQLRQPQVDGVWRTLVGGNTLLAHAVGTGKTFTIVASAMEAKRLGLAKKNMVVVPNHLVEQWASDWMRLYPQARVLAATKDLWEADKRKELMSRIATGDWDAVIVPQSSFTLLPTKPETFQRFMQKQLDMIEEHIRELQGERSERRTVKQLEKAKARIEARIKKAANRERKDNTIDFEDTGVDRLYVDEAHMYKNLFFSTKMGNVNGIPKSDSQRAMDMYVKSKYISELNNGSGVTFATGTPISNTMAEIYTMQRYMDEGKLEETGLQHFDSWAAMFGQTIQNMEISPEDPTKFRVSTRFSKFKNVGDLKRMFRQKADVILPSDLEKIVTLPEIMGGKPTIIEVPASERVLDYIKELGARAEKIRRREVKPTEDNMLKITSEGRKIALDYRSMFPDERDDGESKLAAAARRIADIYKETRDTKRTQAVMLDLMTPSDAAKKKGQFNAYADLKNKLVGMGVPADEIAFIHSAKTDAKKQELFDKVNSGEVAVILGSSDKMGVGTNIQERLIALHHIDAPWRPSDIEQREGRILRQGNSNPVVQIYRYVTQGTFDAYMWNTISRKAQFIHEMMQHGYDVRELEDVDGAALSYAEAAAIATGDQRVLQKVQADAEVDRLNRLKMAYDQQRVNQQVKLAQIPQRIAGVEQAVRDIEDDIKLRKQTVPEKFSMQAGSKTTTDRKEAGSILNAAAEANRGMNARKVGQYGGFEIWADGSGNLRLNGTASHYFETNHENPLGTIQSMERRLAGLETAADTRRESIADLRKNEQALKDEIAKPFVREKELQKALAKQKELNDALAITKEDPTMSGTSEGEEFNEDFKPTEAKPSTREIEEADDEEVIPRHPHGTEAGFIDPELLMWPITVARAIARLAQRVINAGRQEATQPQTVTPEPPRTTTGIPRSAPGEKLPVERAGNIRLDKLNAPDDVINEIRRMAKEHGDEFDEQRRGKIPFKKTRDMAQELINEGMFTEKDLKNMQKGTALNAEELLAARSLLVASATKLRELADRVGKNPSPQGALEFRKALLRHQGIQKSVSGAVAEAGRALSQQRMVAEAMRAENKSNHERVLDSLGGQELSEVAAKKLSEIPADDVVALNNFLRSQKYWTTAQKIEAYWIANILSSPRTVIRKVLGDTILGLAEEGSRAIAGLIDPLVAKAQNRPREYYTAEALHAATSYISAIPEATRKFVYIMGHGFDEDDLMKMEMPFKLEFKGGLKNPLNWGGRSLAAATKFFQFAGFQSELHAQAIRQALKEGLRGAAARDRAAELIQHPMPHMVEAAYEQAKFQTFTEDPDQFARWLMNGRDKIKLPEGIPVIGGMRPLRFLIPFVQIPYNLAKNAVRYSPLGGARLMDVEKAKSAQTSKILARALMGTIVMGALAYWAAKKYLTGAAPEDPAARDAFYRSGKQPFSIRIGDRWVSYQTWGHFALVAGATAAFHDRFDKLAEGDPESVVKLAGAMWQVFTNESFLRGIKNVMDAAQDPDRFAGTTAANFAEGFVPMSSMLRTINDGLDPTVRNPKTIYEKIVAGLPVISKSVPPKLDVLGRPSVREGQRGVAALIPGGIAPAAARSPLDAEVGRLQKLGLKPIGFPAKYLTVDNYKLPLDPQEQQEYQSLRGRYLQAYLRALMSSDEYHGMTDAQKVDAAQRTVREAEIEARDTMIQAALEARMKRVQTAGIPRRPPQMALAPSQ